MAEGSDRRYHPNTGYHTYERFHFDQELLRSLEPLNAFLSSKRGAPPQLEPLTMEEIEGLENRHQVKVVFVQDMHNPPKYEEWINNPNQRVLTLHHTYNPVRDGDPPYMDVLQNSGSGGFTSRPIKGTMTIKGIENIKLYKTEAKCNYRLESERMAFCCLSFVPPKQLDLFWIWACQPHKHDKDLEVPDILDF